MATNKVSQGLSFSTIVLAVISIFILVLVILFVSRGLTGVETTTNVYTRTDLESAQVACRTYCDTALAISDAGDDFRRTDYCQRGFAIGTTPNLKCSSGAIAVNCIGTISGGSVNIVAPATGGAAVPTDDNAPDRILTSCGGTAF